MTDKAPKDSVRLYSCTANCLLYEADPGPSELNIGSVTEPKMVSRSEAYRHLYAQSLITGLSADLDQIRQGRDVYREKLALNPTRGFDPETEREAAEFWECGIAISEIAIDIIESSGAADDDQARQRLLASAEHELAKVAFGFLPEIVAQSGADLVDKLNRIDQAGD